MSNLQKIENCSKNHDYQYATISMFFSSIFHYYYHSIMPIITTLDFLLIRFCFLFLFWPKVHLRFDYSPLSTTTTTLFTYCSTYWFSKIKLLIFYSVDQHIISYIHCIFSKFFNPILIVYFYSFKFSHEPQPQRVLKRPLEPFSPHT